MIVYSFLSSRNSPITSARIDEIITLYRQAGWWQGPEINQDHVRRIVSGSHCFLIALANDTLIGMGRAISDGVSDAYIQDVTVTTTYRKQGIGSEIVKRLTQKVIADGLNWIGLIAERDTHAFYEKIGFKKMPNSQPMIKDNG